MSEPFTKMRKIAIIFYYKNNLHKYSKCKERSIAKKASLNIFFVKKITVLVGKKL